MLLGLREFKTTLRASVSKKLFIPSGIIQVSSVIGQGKHLKMWMHYFQFDLSMYLVLHRRIWYSIQRNNEERWSSSINCCEGHERFAIFWFIDSLINKNVSHYNFLTL